MSRFSDLFDSIKQDLQKEATDIIKKQTEQLQTKIEEKTNEAQKAIEDKIEKTKNKKNKQNATTAVKTNNEGKSQSEIIKNKQQQDKAKSIKEIKDNIAKAAETIVNNHLNKMLKNDIEALKQKYGLSFSTTKAIEDIRSIIRGHYTIQLKREDVIIRAKAATEAKLTAFISDQSKKLNEMYDKTVTKGFTDANHRIDESYQRYTSMGDSALKKLSKVETFMESQENIEKKLSSILSKSMTLDSATKKIDATLAKIGITINSNSMLAPVLKDINKNITTKLGNWLAPHIKEQIKKVKAAQEAIKHVQKIVEKYKEEAKRILNEWKDKATKYVQDKIASYASSALSNIKLRL